MSKKTLKQRFAQKTIDAFENNSNGGKKHPVLDTIVTCGVLLTSATGAYLITDKTPDMTGSVNRDIMLEAFESKIDTLLDQQSKPIHKESANKNTIKTFDLLGLEPPTSISNQEKPSTDTPKLTKEEINAEANNILNALALNTDLWEQDADKMLDTLSDAGFNPIDYPFDAAYLDECRLETPNDAEKIYYCTNAEKVLKQTSASVTGGLLVSFISLILMSSAVNDKNSNIRKKLQNTVKKPNH